MLQQKYNWILKRWQVPPIKAHFRILWSWLLYPKEEPDPWSPFSTTDPDPTACDPRSRRCDPWSRIPRNDPAIHASGLYPRGNEYWLSESRYTFQTEDYLDMLYSSNLLPVITKPTRITSHTATLIDHIYTNASTDQIIPGIVTTDISDHLPTFCFIRRQITRLKPKRFFRDYSNFDSKTYLNDIKSVDWSSILNDPTDIHTKASSFVEKLKGIASKHAPIKRILRSRYTFKHR